MLMILVKGQLTEKLVVYIVKTIFTVMEVSLLSPGNINICCVAIAALHCHPNISGDIPIDVPTNQNIGGDTTPASPAGLTPMSSLVRRVICPKRIGIGLGLGFELGLGLRLGLELGLGLASNFGICTTTFRTNVPSDK